MNEYRIRFESIADDVYHDIAETIATDDPVIAAILNRIISNKGKVARPAFMALAAKCVGGSWQDIRRAATIVEIIHIASLIHDDVVDGSHLRRGTATLNIEYSDKTSVLFGDFLLMKALSAAQSIGHPGVFPILNAAIERMIEGEIREDLAEGLIDEVTYFSIIGGKTASLFAAAGELAVLLSGGDDRLAIIGRQLGEYLGMTFQIVDDTLDFVGETEIMGKPRLKDVMAERFTLPVIHAFKSLPRNMVEKYLFGKHRSAEKIAEIVTTNGGIEYACEHARSYATKAQELIDRFTVPDASAVFEEYLDMILSRVS